MGIYIFKSFGVKINEKWVIMIEFILFLGGIMERFNR